MCTVEGCEKTYVARGYCHKHYGQWRRGTREEGDTRPSHSPHRILNKTREVPEDEAGLVTHTPFGTILEHPGTGTAYSHYGCRCRACRKFNTARANNLRKERIRQGRIPDSAVHGTAGTYRNWGCKCEECRKAGTADSAAYYHRKLSAAARRRAEDESYDEGYEAGISGASKRRADQGFS